jgi:hypothetical protein
LQSAWEKKRDALKYVLYKDALTDGLEKLRKYYSRLDEKPSFVLALGKICSTMINRIFTSPFAVLHPYYKLAYIKVLWGGPEEQAAEIAEGNPYAKDWQDEAKQIVERTVSHSFAYGYRANYVLGRWLSIGKLAHPPSSMRATLL